MSAPSLSSRANITPIFRVRSLCCPLGCFCWWQVWQSGKIPEVIPSSTAGVTPVLQGSLPMLPPNRNFLVGMASKVRRTLRPSVCPQSLCGDIVTLVCVYLSFLLPKAGVNLEWRHSLSGAAYKICLIRNHSGGMPVKWSRLDATNHLKGWDTCF